MCIFVCEFVYVFVQVCTCVYMLVYVRMLMCSRQLTIHLQDIIYSIDLQ